MNPQGYAPTQFQDHRQVHVQAYPPVQHSMPANSNFHIPEVAPNHAMGHQGANGGPMMGQNRQQTPHQPVMVPQMGGGLDQGAAPFVPRLNNEPRQPNRNAAVPTNMNNAHGKQVQGEPSPNGPPHHHHHARKNTQTARPPKVIQKDRQSPHAGKATYEPDDSSSMTEDESLFEDDGYSSASSMYSVPKGSLHRQKKYPEQTLGKQGYRVYERKRGQRDRIQTAYPASTVRSFPSNSALRMRESKRAEDMSRRDRPVSIHGDKYEYPSPGWLGLNAAQETSIGLRRVQEQQQSILDKLDHLTLQSHKSQRLDHIGNEVAPRGHEPDTPIMARPVVYQEPHPFYRRRMSYVPRDTIPYAYDPYF